MIITEDAAQSTEHRGRYLLPSLCLFWNKVTQMQVYV